MAKRIAEDMEPQPVQVETVLPITPSSPPRPPRLFGRGAPRPGGFRKGGPSRIRFDVPPPPVVPPEERMGASFQHLVAEMEKVTKCTKLSNTQARFAVLAKLAKIVDQIELVKQEIMEVEGFSKK